MMEREQLRTATCEVLLLDINMPGRSGLEVLASVRETHPQIRVIMVSMYPEDQYALRSIKAGAAGYANKAGDPVLLIDARYRSGWSMTVAAALLREAGCSAVLPLVLHQQP